MILIKRKFLEIIIILLKKLYIIYLLQILKLLLSIKYYIKYCINYAFNKIIIFILLFRFFFIFILILPSLYLYNINLFIIFERIFYNIFPLIIMEFFL